MIFLLNKPLRLCFYKFFEFSSNFHEFFITPLFYNFSLIKYKDPVGFHDSWEPVGYYKGCSPFHEFIKRFLEMLLGFRIEGWGSLIEDEDWSIFEERSCYRKTLLLSSWEFHSSLSYYSIKPISEILNKVTTMRFLCYSLNVFSCSLAIKTNIL